MREKKSVKDRFESYWSVGTATNPEQAGPGSGPESLVSTAIPCEKEQERG